MPSGLVSVSGIARPAGVVAHQRERVDQPGHRHAVLRLRVVDAVPAGDVAAGRRGHVQPAAQHLGRELENGSTSRGQHSRLSATSGVPPIAYTSESALAAAIRPQSYGSSTTGVKKSVVETSVVPPGDADHRRVVAGVQADQQLAGRVDRPAADQAGDRLLELAGRDLAGTAAAVRVRGQPVHRTIVPAEAYGRLVAPTVFKIVVVRSAGQGGSIPLRLRDTVPHCRRDRATPAAAAPAVTGTAAAGRPACPSRP